MNMFLIPAESFNDSFELSFRRHLYGGRYVDDTFKSGLFMDCLEGFVMSDRAKYPMDKYIGYYLTLYFQPERHTITFQFSREVWTRQPELVGMDPIDFQRFNVIMDECMDSSDDVEVCKDCLHSQFVGMMSNPDKPYSVKEMRSLCRECDAKVEDGSAIDYGFKYEEVLDDAYKVYRREQARLGMAKKKI